MVITNSRPLFSILLPTYNREDVVGFTIKSVLDQTISDFELLIVGDGCSDSTERIVKQFAHSDKRVKWFPFKKGAGFGYKHRNVVLKKATGRYIAFAAHDDLWAKDHLELFLKFFNENKDYTLAYSRPLWVYIDGTILPSSFNTDDSFVKEIFLKIHNEIPASCVVHRSDVTRRVGFLNARLKKAADWDLWKRVVNKDKLKRIGFISNPSIFHFRAKWRSDTNSWDSYLTAIYRIIHRSSYLRNKLVIKPNKGKPLQEAFWRKIAVSSKFISEVRKDCAVAIDSLAQEITKVAAENKNLEWNIEKVTSTKGYRFLEFMRKLIH